MPGRAASVSGGPHPARGIHGAEPIRLPPPRHSGGLRAPESRPPRRHTHHVPHLAGRGMFYAELNVRFPAGPHEVGLLPHIRRHPQRHWVSGRGCHLQRNSDERKPWHGNPASEWADDSHHHVAGSLGRRPVRRGAHVIRSALGRHHRAHAAVWAAQLGAGARQRLRGRGRRGERGDQQPGRVSPGGHRNDLHNILAQRHIPARRAGCQVLRGKLAE
mmetsp:Transcript_15561/g.40249  ORF Transcript_15561/g.40249 Transcript_15561/m.40249 type:complete len:217 (-) Transcript_15561:73-723(-)